MSAVVVFDLGRSADDLRPERLRPGSASADGAGPPWPGHLVGRRREDYVQVKLTDDEGSLSAEPVFGKSNLIYTMVRASGVVKVPLDAGGLYAGDEVDVRVY